MIILFGLQFIEVDRSSKVCCYNKGVISFLCDSLITDYVYKIMLSPRLNHNPIGTWK